MAFCKKMNCFTDFAFKIKYRPVVIETISTRWNWFTNYIVYFSVCKTEVGFSLIVNAITRRFIFDRWCSYKYDYKTLDCCVSSMNLSLRHLQMRLIDRRIDVDGDFLIHCMNDIKNSYEYPFSES